MEVLKILKNGVIYEDFLIRHGESIQNTGLNNSIKLPDNKVYLTEKGKEQAKKAGEFLLNYVDESKIDLSNATLWVSPYYRARETALIINSILNISDVKEDIALIEQMYGLFSDNSLEDCRRKYPEQFELYDRFYQMQGKFFAKLPQGESPFDVALRVRQFLETIFRDKQNGKDTLVIVTHGTVIRCFLLDYFHYSPEWFNNEPNMENCSIRFIDEELGKNVDRGYIYGGSCLKRIK